MACPVRDPKVLDLAGLSEFPRIDPKAHLLIHPLRFIDAFSPGSVPRAGAATLSGGPAVNLWVSSAISPPVPWPALLAVERHGQLEQVLHWRVSRLAAANAINCCRRNVCEGMANEGSLQAQTIEQRP